MSQGFKQVLIVGGGAAGWMTAAAFAVSLPGEVRITLVESEAIGAIGVGESTTPALRLFNSLLGVDEADFIRRTQASFKLGVAFKGWGDPAKTYFHPFGLPGRPFNGLEPYALWRRLRALGDATPFSDYCLCTRLARENRFTPPSPDMRSVLSEYDYAYHLDAGLYADYLRDFAQKRGVRRVEGVVADVRLHAESGDIAGVVLEDGRRLEADFFIDCSGSRALLIEGALGASFTDWSRWLPVDRAWAAPSAPASQMTPYTQATARAAGWRWRIPLQHRVGNGHVFASAFMSDQAALDDLLQDLDGEPLSAPRLIHFRTGYRPEAWRRNCLAIGMSAGFMEPLEATAILTIQTSIIRFLDLQPRGPVDPALSDEFNRQAAGQFEHIRDFLLLHYLLSEGDERPFWRRMRQVDLPDTLQDRIDMFKARGDVPAFPDVVFHPPSWAFIFDGGGLVSDSYDPLVDALPEAQLRQIMQKRRADIIAAAPRVPLASEFIAQRCAAPAEPLLKAQAS